MQPRKIILLSIGALIQERRRLTGLTQEDLANGVGVTREVLANYELGRQEVFVDHLFAIAEILGSEPEDLLVDVATIGTNAVCSIAPGAPSIQMQKLARLMTAPPDDYLGRREDDAQKT